jgi:hypothetical protein
MIKPFLVGVNEANRNWKMILALLAANLLLSLPVVVPVFLLIVFTSGGTLAADRLFADKLDVLWFIDVLNQQFPGAALETALAQVGSLLAVMGVVYLFLNTFFAGAIIGVFNSVDGRFTMRKFGGEGAAYFWRFFRLLLISLFFYAAAFGVYLLARWPIDNAAEKASAFESVVYKRWAAMALLALLWMFVNMVFDYAKIATVVNDSKGMFRETFRALRFAFKNFFGAFGLYLLIALVGLGVFLVFNSLRWNVNQSSAIGVFLAIALGQLAIAGRMWNRLVFYAAELSFYKKLAPARGIAQAVVESQLEFARAEAPEAPETLDAPDALAR